MTTRKKTPPLPIGLRKRIRKITTVVLDVDGVLTPGWILWRAVPSPSGEAEEFISFHTHDGSAIKILQMAGLRIALMSGRCSPVAQAWATKMEIPDLYFGFLHKRECYEAYKKKYHLRDEEICYLGDDLTDRPVLQRVGLAVAVANAAPEIYHVAHYITTRRGGEGAVREVAELILKTQNRWSAILNWY